MKESLYVYAVATHGSASGIEGYQTLTLMRLSFDDAVRKADLLAELKKLDSEFPKPTDFEQSPKPTDFEQRVNSLCQMYNNIKGPMEAYVVRGQFKIGQILSEIPVDAVPADEFFKKR